MRSESRVKLRIASPDRRELGFWTPPAALKAQRVQPALMNEYIRGWFHCGLFAAGLLIVVLFLKWSAA